MKKLAILTTLIFSSNLQAHESKELFHLHQSGYLLAFITSLALLGFYKFLKFVTKEGEENV